MSDLPIPAHNLTIPGDELSEQTSASGGPGGQHANKTASKVTLRWNVTESRVLSNTQRNRLLKNLQNRLTLRGELVIQVSDHRSQHQNRDTARTRLARIVEKGLHRPKTRRATKPSWAAKRRRMDQKRKRGALKEGRRKVRQDD